MIQIRTNCFETNSSSIHALIIPKDTTLHIPSSVHLSYGSYGWGIDTITDTLNYIYTACKDYGQYEVDKLIEYLKSKGVEEITESSEQENERNYGIDHYRELPLAEIFDNESLLDRFIFSDDAKVILSNDNLDDETITDDLVQPYENDDYDIIWK